MVRRAGARLRGGAQLCGQVVCAPPLARGRGASGRQAPPKPAAAAHDRHLARHPALPDVLEIRLHLEHVSSFYTFYLIDTFGLRPKEAQVDLFVYLAAFAAGTLLGGPIGDRIGRKAVIWFSVLGALPFTLALPYANHFWAVVLSVPIGFILASAFSAMLVYAQELLPGRVGLISGLFFGVAFGIAAVGAALLGWLADAHVDRLRLPPLLLPAGHRASHHVPARARRHLRAAKRVDLSDVYDQI